MLMGGLILASVLSATGICLGSGWGQHWWWLMPTSLLGCFIGWVVVAFLVLWISCKLVNQDKPQEEDSRYYRWLVNMYGPFLLTIAQAHIDAKGFEQVPKNGRFLLVCNHLHEADPVVLMKYMPKSQLSFIGKLETKNMFLVGAVMHKLLCQYINRANDKEALKTILACIRLVKEDKVSIGVFPEGYIRPNRKLHRFRSGVFKIATKTNIPIVVCTITNTNHLIKNFIHLKPTYIDLHLVKVIQPEEYAELSTVELGEQIYQLMAEDLGPDRVSQDDEEIS